MRFINFKHVQYRKIVNNLSGKTNSNKKGAEKENNLLLKHTGATFQIKMFVKVKPNNLC